MFFCINPLKLLTEDIILTKDNNFISKWVKSDFL